MLQEEKGKKTAMVMKMPKITVKNKNNETPEDVKFTKTGRTKIIDGHTCYEYIGETEKQKTTFWAAPDLKYNLAESMLIMQSQNKQHFCSYFGSYVVAQFFRHSWVYTFWVIFAYLLYRFCQQKK